MDGVCSQSHGFAQTARGDGAASRMARTLAALRHWAGTRGGRQYVTVMVCGLLAEHNVPLVAQVPDWPAAAVPVMV